MDPATSRFIERFGLMFEQEGFPRIAGRVTAFLLVSPGAQSLDEIAEALGVSKASVSTDARRLEAKGLVTRTSRPGDRRDYYEFAPDGFRTTLQSRLDATRRFGALLAEARQLPLESEDTRTRVNEWSDFNTAMTESLAALLERWSARDRSHLTTPA
jgi:DNA-binding transcriptional regulator GbsR (MarR family)